MLKKIVAVVALATGFSWAVTASASPASADDHVRTDASVQADADVQAVLKAVPGATVREFDLHKEGDLCALLSLILGLDLSVDADVSADVDATGASR